jgi:hypothetical protein
MKNSRKKPELDKNEGRQYWQRVTSERKLGIFFCAVSDSLLLFAFATKSTTFWQRCIRAEENEQIRRRDMSQNVITNKKNSIGANILLKFGRQLSILLSSSFH